MTHVGIWQESSLDGKRQTQRLSGENLWSLRNSGETVVVWPKRSWGGDMGSAWCQKEPHIPVPGKNTA